MMWFVILPIPASEIVTFNNSVKNNNKSCIIYQIPPVCYAVVSRNPHTKRIIHFFTMRKLEFRGIN